MTFPTERDGLLPASPMMGEVKRAGAEAECFSSTVLFMGRAGERASWPVVR